MPDVLGDALDAITTPINAVGDVLDKIPVIGPYLAPLGLTLAGQPELAAAYSGQRSSNKTGNPLSGVLSGIGTYAGNAAGSALGSSLADSTGGLLAKTPSNALGDLFGGETVGALSPIGSSAGNALGSANLGSFLGGALGSNVGGQMGEQLGGGAAPPSTDPTPFNPTRAPSLGLPQSLSQFGSLDQDQQLSNVANKGVYGGGNSPDESKYFLNLVNNRLVDQTGNVGGMDQLNPIENSYLAQLGLGGYGNSNDLLKGIQNYSG